MTLKPLAIPLTQGKFALVDADDFEFLNQWKWHLRKTDGVYAVRGVWNSKKKQNTFIRMHRQIMNAPNNAQVDHINGNGLDNRKSNLRLCSQSQNNANTKLREDNTSGYKGVGWHTYNKKWRARIGIFGKPTLLGYFNTKEEAYKAYCLKAKEIYGGFAKI